MVTLTTPDTDIAALLLTGVSGAAIGVVGTYLKSHGELKVKAAEIADLMAQRSERARDQRRERYAALLAELDRLEGLGRAGSKILGICQHPELAGFRAALAAVESKYPAGRSRRGRGRPYAGGC